MQPRDEHEPLHLAPVLGEGVGQHGLEAGARAQLGQAAGGPGQPQQSLVGHHHQRLALVPRINNHELPSNF